MLRATWISRSMRAMVQAPVHSPVDNVPSWRAQVRAIKSAFGVDTLESPRRDAYSMISVRFMIEYLKPPTSVDQVAAGWGSRGTPIQHCR